jgi:hypothetical protein
MTHTCAEATLLLCMVAAPAWWQRQLGGSLGRLNFDISHYSSGCRHGERHHIIAGAAFSQWWCTPVSNLNAELDQQMLKTTL